MRRSAKWNLLRRLAVALMLAGLFSVWWLGLPSRGWRGWRLTTGGSVQPPDVPQSINRELSVVKMSDTNDAVSLAKAKLEVEHSNAKLSLSAMTRTAAMIRTATTTAAIQQQNLVQQVPTADGPLTNINEQSSMMPTQQSLLDDFCTAAKSGKKAEKAAAFLVISGAVSREAAAQRAAVLSTWGSQLQQQRRLIFYSPIASKGAAQAPEATVQGNLLTISHSANQNRILAGLIWVRHRCPNARAIVLTTDRSFWNVARLDEFLKSRQFNAGSKAIYGNWPRPETETLLAAQAGYVLPGPAVDALMKAAASLTGNQSSLGGIPVTGPLREAARVEAVQLDKDLLQAASNRPIRVGLLACKMRSHRLMALNGVGVGHTVRLWRRLQSAGLKCYKEHKKKYRRNYPHTL